ncbi:NADH dehydrogenase subunit 1 (mitochondrion) [Dermatophagoides farinae]|uniref:NADH dehydrogenase subunit 1 n=1 Tax=Dermatophagoides farinae TaxID=6954 RepID=UPI0001B2DB83|nr:NADH dehydrogenase subunit 1 [Dermatophagoides farinae]ACV04219.1 NADH dehydrogenase subunit 1 [Dermatophagoides farinae]
MFYLSSIFSTIGVLLGIAFFTLVERKIMSLMHYRKGPNKVLIMGLLQPITDATKLFTKENSKLQPLKIFMFVGAPLLGMFLMMMCWLWYESVFSSMNNKLKIFSILAIMSLSVFVFLMTSWGSNSKYSIIGGYRAISQIISYEVCFMIFLFILFYLMNSYSIMKLKLMQENMWFCFLSIPLFFCWMMMCMAESNRTPFDLAEGESEIVSGFNIEYGGGLFALIFIMEYGMIMFLSFVSNLFFLGLSLSLLKTFLVCFMFIWVRCCFPRLRYDKLMHLCWKTYLPCSLSVLMLSSTMFFL